MEKCKSTDYFQMFLEKNKEVQFLTNHLSSSKQKVVNLQLKLIDFLCSVKSLETSLDLENLLKATELENSTINLAHSDVESTIADEPNTESCVVESPAILRQTVNNHSTSDALNLKSTESEAKDTIPIPRGTAIPELEMADFRGKYTVIKAGTRRLYSCIECKKVFGFISILKRHFRSHTGNYSHKPLGGNIFEKRTSQATGLSQAELKSLECRICGRKFNQAVHLLRHQVSHRHDRTQRPSSTVTNPPVSSASIATTDSTTPNRTHKPAQIVRLKPLQEKVIVIPEMVTILPDLPSSEVDVKSEPLHIHIQDVASVHEVGLSDEIEFESEEESSNKVDKYNLSSNSVNQGSSISKFVSTTEPPYTRGVLKLETQRKIEHKKSVSDGPQSTPQKAYAVVKFKSNEIKVVYSEWLFSNNTKSYWPPEFSSRTACNRCTPANSPTIKWSIRDVVAVLTYGRTFEEAIGKYRNQEFSSESESDSLEKEKKTRKFRKRKKRSDSSNDEEMEPETSKSGKKSVGAADDQSNGVSSERQVTKVSSKSPLKSTGNDPDRNTPNFVLDHQYSYGSDGFEHQNTMDTSGLWTTLNSTPAGTMVILDEAPEAETVKNSIELDFEVFNNGNSEDDNAGMEKYSPNVKSQQEIEKCKDTDLSKLLNALSKGRSVGEDREERCKEPCHTCKDYIKEIELLEEQLHIMKLKEKAEAHKSNCKDLSIVTTVPTASENNIAIGSNGTLVNRIQLDRCRKYDYAKYTGDLMVILFGREALSYSVIKGIKGILKPVLDAVMVEDVQEHVSAMFNVTVRDVRTVIRYKLNCESKRAAHHRKKITC